jgi:hypothetical protein
MVDIIEVLMGLAILGWFGLLAYMLEGEDEEVKDTTSI